MAVPYRFAACNEIFQEVPFAEACKQVRSLGYDGLEIAPFTLGEDPAALTGEQRAELARIVTGEGLEFVGLHWLLMAPEGLHITSRDEAIRQRSWDYVHKFIDLCADLAGTEAANHGVLVFGSPKQRSAVDGLTPREASDIFTHELAHTAPHAELRGVKLLVEALPANQTNVVNCLSDAVSIVKQIGSPAVQTMFDTHNAVDEKDAHTALVRKYLPYIQHVHVNEIDGQEPGMGDYAFGPLLTALAELNYSGWVSVEAFDFSRSPQEIAKRAIDHLKAALPETAQTVL